MSEKIKIRNLKGIYTNADENDISLEYVKSGINFKFKQGYAEYEERNLAEYTMPDLTTLFPTHSFTWETGTYCTLTNDFLSTEGETAWKVNALVLIAKENDGGVYNRLIFMKDLTTPTSWLELSKNGDVAGIEILNHDGTEDFSDSLFSTGLNGEVFFQQERGALKIFFPHDAYKLQYINRDTAFDSIDHDGWYLDRLIEPYNVNDSGVQNDEAIVEIVDGSTVRALITSSGGRRVGFKFVPQVVESGFFDEETLTLVTPGASEVSGSFVFYKYEFQSSLGDTIIPPWLPSDYEEDDKWYFYAQGQTGVPYYNITNIIIPETLAKEIEPDGTTWAAIATSYGDHNTHFLSGPAGYNPYKISNSWLITRTVFEAQTWLKTAGYDVSTAGWVTATDRYNYSIIVTAVFDEREEVIIERYNGKVVFAGAPPSNFALKIKDIFIPTNLNKRITRFRLYHKFTDTDVDYTLHKEISLLDSKTTPYEPFFIGDYTDSGTALAGEIGFLFNNDNPDAYQILRGFKSLATIGDISLALATGDTANIYYSTVGGGRLMSDLIYDQNLLPLTGISNIAAIVPLANKMAVFTDKKVFIISAGEALGQAVFSLSETLDLGVDSIKSVAPIRGGAVALTANGIFMTDGYEMTLISEQINNLVRLYYLNSKLYYNAYKHEIYLKYDSLSNLYRYRFEDKVWEEVNIG